MSTKRKMAMGTLWGMIGTSFNQIFSFLIFVLLARLLTPTEFGVVGLATIFIEMSRQFISGGIPDALIRQREWNQSLASTAFWLNMALALGVCAICIGVGAPALSAFGYAGIGPVFAILSLTLLVDAAR